MKQYLQMYRSLHFIAISGNIIFVFWILMYGINEAFEGTLPEIFSFIGLIVLLLLKAFLLYKH